MPVKDIWYKKYLNIKGRAKERGVDFLLSLEEYKQLAFDVGIKEASEIGRTSGKFHLGRIGDKGPYAVGNCRFIPREQNDLEALNNGAYDEVSRLRTGTSKLNDGGRLATSKKLERAFEITSPEGVTIKGVNITEFCQQNNLDQGAISRVFHGKSKHHKGWIGKYI